MSNLVSVPTHPSDNRPYITQRQAAIVSDAQRVHEQYQSRVLSDWAPRMIPWEWETSQFQREGIHRSTMGDIHAIQRDVSHHSEILKSKLQQFCGSPDEGQKEESLCLLKDIPDMRETLAGLEAVDAWMDKKIGQCSEWVDCRIDPKSVLAEFYKQEDIRPYFPDRGDELVLGVVDRALGEWKKHLLQFGILFSLFEMNEKLYKTYHREKFQLWNHPPFDWRNAKRRLQIEEEALKERISLYSQLSTDLSNGLMALDNTDSSPPFSFQKKKFPLNRIGVFPDLEGIVDSDLMAWPRKFAALKRNYLELLQQGNSLGMQARAKDLKNVLAQQVEAMSAFNAQLQKRLDPYSALLKWATPKLGKVSLWVDGQSGASPFKFSFLTDRTAPKSHPGALPAGDSEEPSGRYSAAYNWVGSKIEELLVRMLLGVSPESIGDEPKAGPKKGKGQLVAQRIKQLQKKQEADKSRCQKLKGSLAETKQFYRERPTASLLLFASFCWLMTLAWQRFVPLFEEDAYPLYREFTP